MQVYIGIDWSENKHDPLTRQIRAKVSLIAHLTSSHIRLSNRLRAVLLRYYPAALEVFTSLSAPTTLAFIQTYPTPQAAADLTISEFRALAAAHNHRRPDTLSASFARLQAPQPAARQRLCRPIRTKRSC